MNKKTKNLKFGDYVFARRIKLAYTLRQFCKTKGYDPAYISRVENNLIQAPEDQEKLKALALALELKPNTSDWVTFFDLAAASHFEIPQDIKKDNPEIIKLLPAFYRTLRKPKANKEDVSKLLDLIISSKEENDRTQSRPKPKDN